MINMYIVPWLCWGFPFIGALLTLITSKFSWRARDFIAITFSFLAFLMALFLLPSLIAGVYFETPGIVWISLPNMPPITFGALVTPLSVIMAIVVSLISFLIMVYSMKYMHKESGVTRYWFIMNIFIGGMLFLVLSNNFIQFLIGWKIVGFASYMLIGHYYRDDREHWIGGPDADFRVPSYCGLKALIVTTIGDVMLIAGILIIFAYSGTLNFMELYQNAPVWMANMAKTPGILALTGILLVGGPMGKSAQFPLHEWLPDAMAGPAPVSALIHAATMVKAGVYLVALIFPIFYYGYHVAGYSEAASFFILIIAIGTFTLFLTATQGMASLEIKKVLAFSTMSQIGYMMLALGVAGLSAEAVVTGYSAAIFHLVSHALFKAVLFLGAGAVIHVSGSIYLNEMGGLRRRMRLTWAFMWIAMLSMSGFPLLSGFWSKDAVLTACLEANQIWLFVIALVTVAITTFYSFRTMGMTFYGKNSKKLFGTEKEHDVKDASPIMWIPYGLMAGLTLFLGATGPLFNKFLQEKFAGFFIEGLALSIESTAVHPALHYTAMGAALAMVAVGSLPAYILYISKKKDSFQLLTKYQVLKALNKFVTKRWYMDPTLHFVFSTKFLRFRMYTEKTIETPLESAFDISFPALFSAAYYGVRKVQTGVLSWNIIYAIFFIALFAISFLLILR